MGEQQTEPQTETTAPDAQPDAQPGEGEQAEGGFVAPPPREGDDAAEGLDESEGDDAAAAPDDAEAQPGELAHPEGEVVTPAPRGRSEKEQEKLFRELDRLRETNAARVGRILGDEATDVITCPMCATAAPGFILPMDTHPMPDEQKEAILVVLGFQPPQQFKAHPTWHRCDACDGLGRVETGSEVPGYGVVDCPSCTGKGYVAPTLVHPNTTATAGETMAVTVTGPTVNGGNVATPPLADEPAVAELKRRGFIVVPPTNFQPA